MLEKEVCLLCSGWERECKLSMIRAVLSNHLAEVVTKTKISENNNEEETEVLERWAFT